MLYANGSPVAINRSSGTRGYLGKPYDSITGLYNYGYRDYSPQTVRFTTVDPIRDGSNWFAYVNNDPVNYVDLWGLLASDVKVEKGFGRAILSGVGKIGTGTLKTIAGGLGVAAGVAVSSWVDNGLEAVEKWIFSSQE